MKNNIRCLGYIILASFVVLAFYVGYVNVFMGPALATDPHNGRLAAWEAGIKRGTIFDRQGVVLAKTENGRRVYPLGQDTAQVVGFISRRYGRTGLESAYDRYLLGMTDDDKIQALINRLLGRPRVGNDLVVTLDARLQHLARELLGQRKGAVAALDPRSGAILALASSPGFDPNQIDQPAAVPGRNNGTVYDLLQRDPNAPLLNRAAQGAYPPGSTFKIVTGAGALTADPSVSKRIFNCQGSLTVDGFKLPDLAAHGAVDFRRAMAVSCNTTFATLGLELGVERFYQNALAFGLTRNPWEHNLPGVPGSPELDYRPGTLTPPKKMTRPELASSAIGQGEVLVNPLQMALAAAAIAHNGVIMRPHLLERIQEPGGRTLVKAAPQAWLTATSPAVAAVVKEAMVAVVREGTGKGAALPGVTVAGKTGSAQNPRGDTHAWFVAFAPAEEPRVVVAVIIENGGAGGAVAAPVAREVIRAALAG
ncbi:cell division protein FtsI [Desulfofundulus thermobenzoicus]|uniref:Cell division protein FtsI n=1 Tax=Desulfofundulus thermobenzoicus TaxID=29376 RepID=A0A6N7ITU6_9FIRM|nr:penicillin-binding transpeptidase domain-containing protein [Desulfofundulus thermobenzoicus]MQL53546.1 cell division protein FtsI [Desulfofundulus thermobenzoicus]HHW43608.1 cell division protein FtsI [Desulfotomaculum sp.]